MTKKSPFFAKIHPNLFECDKFRKIDPQTLLDWLRILLHCVRNESDGFISTLAASELVQGESLSDLMERNLLERAIFNRQTGVPQVLPEGVSTIEKNRKEIEENRKFFTDGYLIHDYTDHQTSKAEIESRRDIERKKSQARRNKAKVDANAMLEASRQGLSDTTGWSSNA